MCLHANCITMTWWGEPR